jgi:hypothetical protein
MPKCNGSLLCIWRIVVKLCHFFIVGTLANEFYIFHFVNVVGTDIKWRKTWNKILLPYVCQHLNTLLVPAHFR